jgi:hypothetical protein
VGILVVLGLLMMGGRKAFASSPASKGKGKGKRRETPEEAAADGAHLVQRANQQTALAWAPVFAALSIHSTGAPIHVPPELAAALARWTGIESSGIPITSARDERGIMQVGPGLGGPATKPPPPAFNDGEWLTLSDPETSHDTQAGWGMHYVDWLYGRASKYIKDAPADLVDQLWYAKLYHQRPVDVATGKMHGPAVAMARELAKRWADDATAMHRLRAANVVAWGTPTP